jgi:hypothetical protein
MPIWSLGMDGLEMSMGALGRNASEITFHGESYDAAPLAARGIGGSSWGDDGLFGLFAAAYAECTQVAIAAYGGISADIRGTGDGMHAVISNTRMAEDVNTANVGHSPWG